MNLIISLKMNTVNTRSSQDHHLEFICFSQTYRICSFSVGVF
ncbi:hypothetical protein CLOSTMETH_00072 [[Clostridium] methylpentosum DSM 5476]|uniref:Uncharacterized protein n=1 Tax=[Clostridium] methylpentosum DSM 5476 TaxID=537013 RepID=C0E8A0_9FIRM|nr:hypothetical protein CLOSTMETH_00072 [[Clostridium] methylpentosum DSM 5476]